MYFLINKFAKYGTIDKFPGRGRQQYLLRKNARKLCRGANINSRLALADIDERLAMSDWQVILVEFDKDCQIGLCLNNLTFKRCLNKNGLHGHRPRQTALHNTVMLQLSPKTTWMWRQTKTTWIIQQRPLG